MTDNPQEIKAMKSLKDYLHLYLGCNVIYNEQQWTLTMYDCWNSECHLDNVSDDGNGDIVKASEVKPILRPLSDMTARDGADVGISVEYYRMVLSGQANHFTAEQIVILLSKSFDLFGLIESGLAIDKTKSSL